MIKRKELEEEIKKIKGNEEEQGIFHDNIDVKELNEVMDKIDVHEEVLPKSSIQY